LCYLEGLTRDEAAKQLGLPASTLKGRLEQARERLRARLASRGLALAGALVASIFSEGTATSAVPSVLLDSTVEAARAVAAGGVAASVVPAHIAALAEGVIHAMFMTKLKIALAVLLAMVSFGAAVRMAQVKAAGPAPDDNAAPQAVAGASGAAVQQGPNDGGLRQQLQQQRWFVAHVDAAANTITVQLQPPIAITFTRSGTSASGPQVANARAVKELGKAQARLRIVAPESGRSAVAVLGSSHILLKLGVAANAEVIIDGQPGDLADLQASNMQVSLQLAPDQPIITRLEAFTPGKVIVKAVDIENKMITVSAEGKDWTASLAADAKVMDEDNQEVLLPNLSTGIPVSVSLGVDKDSIVIQAIRITGE
jgi:membrane protein implicated in regulation of membrane protease activity